MSKDETNDERAAREKFENWLQELEAADCRARGGGGRIIQGRRACRLALLWRYLFNEEGRRYQAESVKRMIEDRVAQQSLDSQGCDSPIGQATAGLTWWLQCPRRGLTTI
jgi:hypothetical protein